MKKRILITVCTLIFLCSFLSGCQGISDSAAALLDSKCSELIDYFNELALYAKDGEAGSGYIMRWDRRIRIKLFGDYTEEDYTTVKGFIDSLNAIEGIPEITISDNAPNYSIYFIPQDKMKSTIPSSDADDWGRSEIWDYDNSIYKAHTGVANDVTTQYERNRLIFHQMVSCMGFLHNSDKYTDSIFNSEWREVKSLSDMDFELLRLLYSPSIRAGMNEAQVKEALLPLARVKYIDSYLD